MAKGTRTAHPRAARLISFTLALFLMLLWSTGAYAQSQSRDYQYGSPTAPVGPPAGQVASGTSGVGPGGQVASGTSGVGPGGQVASGTLGVLPDTGGPSLLVAGTSLLVLGTGAALVGRRNGRR
jgi:hypothetical protein